MNKSRIPIKSHNHSSSSTSSSRAMVFPSNSSTTENIEQPKRFCTESTPISWMSEEPELEDDEDLKPTREDGSRDDHDPSDASNNNSSSDEGDEDLLQGLIKQAWAPKSHKISGGQPFGAAKV